MFGWQTRERLSKHGQKYPQLGACPEPNNQWRPDILQPHISERAIGENPRLGNLSNRTKIRKITNRSNELVSNKVHRPQEGTYEGLINILRAAQVVAPIERLETGWKAQTIAKGLAQLRAAQVASFEAGGFIWIN